MRELLIATGNPGKFEEIKEIFCDTPFLIRGLFDLGISGDGLEEDGKTFQENACKKARFFAEKTGMMTLAEDSGIIVSALKDELGIKTRRWGLGEGASDGAWVRYFLDRMKGEKDRSAKFVCVSCLVDLKNGIQKYFEGETTGKITLDLEAEILPGLPLSSCFLPDGCDEVYAALSTEGKNEVSHRGKAMKAVKEWMEQNFIGGLNF